MRTTTVLRSEREQHFLTQAELAEKSGVSIPTINSLEHGKTGANLVTLRKLAEALGIDPAVLAPLRHPQMEESHAGRNGAD